MNFQENLEDFENSAAVLAEGKGAHLVQRIYARTSNFISVLKELELQRSDSEDSVQLQNVEDDAVRNYLNLSYVFGQDGSINGAQNPIQILLNSSTYESINCSKLPDLVKESSRNIVVMEFFTHCCINCIHSIEDLRQVYQELTKKDVSQPVNTTPITESFNCGLKFISVHSPKFTREKDSESIRAFTKRMKMDYSNVINDPGCVLWNELGICCWPTVLVFGPNPQSSGPNLIFTLMGEGHKDVLRMFLKSSIKYFNEKFKFDENNLLSNLVDLKMQDQTDATVSTFLKYPGKVTCHGKLLAISDSGNNRIVITTVDGNVKNIIGGMSKGYKNGDFESARFYNPQGVEFSDENVLYVADTGNHAIRKVDLNARTVETLVPPGWNTQVGEECVVLKSPWDLVFYKNVLMVAAAGNHRIFGYFFESQKLFNVEHEKNSFSVVAGSGREENRNNSYILKACFAQPSGICVSQETNESDIGVFIADSESSSIRAITNSGKVIGLVGGARDPTDLFAYGDVDGKGVDAKMQHPMGVCWNSATSSVFAVDTYNHKVKVINLGTKDKRCCTIIGDGISGNQLGRFNTIISEDKSVFARLNEPGGLCCDGDKDLLYIADTNNHLIKVANLSQQKVNEFSLIIGGKNIESGTQKMSDWNEIFNVPVNPLIKKLNLEVLIHHIPKDFEGGQWNLQGNETFQKCCGAVEKDAEDDVGKLKIDIPCLSDNKQFNLSVDVFLCGDSSCYKKTLKFLINVSDKISNEEKKDSETNISFTYLPDRDFFLQ